MFRMSKGDSGLGSQTQNRDNLGEEDQALLSKSNSKVVCMCMCVVGGAPFFL